MQRVVCLFCVLFCIQSFLPSLGLQALYDTFSLFGNILSCKARFAACAKMGFRLEVKGHRRQGSTPEIQVLEDQNNNKLYVYKYLYIYVYEYEI